MENEKPILRGELALMAAIVINSFSVVLMLYSGSGISAISSVPYAFSEVFKETICNDPQVCRIVDLPVYYELETNNGNRDYRIQIGGHYMNYNTVYVGMDVHKESFTLCSCRYEDEKASHYQRTPASYKNVLRYLAFLRTIYGEDTRFLFYMGNDDR